MLIVSGAEIKLLSKHRAEAAVRAIISGRAINRGEVPEFYRRPSTRYLITVVEPEYLRRKGDSVAPIGGTKTCTTREQQTRRDDRSFDLLTKTLYRVHGRLLIAIERPEQQQEKKQARILNFVSSSFTAKVLLK